MRNYRDSMEKRQKVQICSLLWGSLMVSLNLLETTEMLENKQYFDTLMWHKSWNSVF